MLCSRDCRTKFLLQPDIVGRLFLKHFELPSIRFREKPVQLRERFSHEVVVRGFALFWPHIYDFSACSAEDSLERYELIDLHQAPTIKFWSNLELCALNSPKTMCLKLLVIRKILRRPGRKGMPPAAKQLAHN